MSGSGMRVSVTRWITADDSLAARKLRSRVGGLLFVIGSVLILVAANAQPEWAQTDHIAIYVSAAVFGLGGLALVGVASAVSAITGYLILIVAVAGTAFAQFLADPATSAGQAIALPDLWVVVIAAMYCTVAATALLVLLVGAVNGVVLAAAHTTVWLPQWSMMFGTCVVVAAAIARLSRELHQRAYTDVLTGVANRRSLMLRLEQEIENAARRGTPLAVLLIDLDKFKEVNDARGHAAGDAALVNSVRAWQAELRADDLLARLGGDEFLAVLPGCDGIAARPIAERMVAAISSLEIPLSCSIGMTEFRAGDTADTMLHRTDRAMYASKESGGNNVILLSDPL